MSKKNLITAVIAVAVIIIAIVIIVGKRGSPEGRMRMREESARSITLMDAKTGDKVTLSVSEAGALKKDEKTSYLIKGDQILAPITICHSCKKETPAAPIRMGERTFEHYLQYIHRCVFCNGPVYNVEPKERPPDFVD